MASQSESGFPDEGLVIEAELDLIRKAAAKVIYEFEESVESLDGAVAESKSSFDDGDQVVFRENISPCPATVVATFLGTNQWFVFTSADCAESKCDDHQAKKCARLISQNFRILRDFLVSESVKLEGVSKWRMSLASDSKAQTIIDRATRRWSH